MYDDWISLKFITSNAIHIYHKINEEETFNIDLFVGENSDCKESNINNRILRTT